jgi:F-type H+/Na+-transporting ATPase subunit alpha
VKEFELEFLEFMETRHKDILNKLAAGKLDDSITEVLEKAAKEVSSRYKPA